MSDSLIKIPFDIFGRSKSLSAYVLDPVRKPLCRIQGITEFNITPKFNDISEISFEVQRFVTNPSTLESQENDAYKYLHAFAQIYVPELGEKGYFLVHEEPIVAVNSTRQETKTFTAMSYESILEYESLVNFSINCGTDVSKEMYDENLDAMKIPQERIRLYDAEEPRLSLLDWVLKDDYYGWQIGHVDNSIARLERAFEIDNQNVYSFLHADVSQAFRCIFDFDTKHKLINVYDIETVGKDTNVYLSIEHFLQQVQISPHNENIYTVFNVQGDGELGIENVNFGSQKIINIDYPLSMVDETLYQKYKAYETYRNNLREQYSETNKLYADVLTKIDCLLDRQPEDEINNNWSSTIYYSLDDLRTMKLAFEQVCQMLEGLYTDEETHQVDYDALYLSPDAALYASYKSVCIPDIASEIEHRESDGVEDATEVEQEFVWELYGLNDLMTEAKKLEEQIATYRKQGYDQTWSADLGFLDRDEFNAHHDRYVLLTQKLTECNALINKKQQQYDDLCAERDELLDQIIDIADAVSLEGCHMFTAAEIAKITELYRESDYTNNNFALNDWDDAVSTVVLQNELYTEAEKELQKESRPQYEWMVNAHDLFAMKEFAPLKKQIQIGDFVWLGRNSKAKPHWQIDKQKFRVTQLAFSGLSDNQTFEITFSTMIQTDLERTDFEELLDSAISSSVNSMSVGVANKATATAAKVTNSLLKPYIEVINAKIDNLEAQRITAEDLRATSGLIEHLTVFDLEAAEITADKSIVLTSRDGYGSIVIENSTMRFKDANDDDRVVIGKRGNSYVVNIYSEADGQGNQELLWGSEGISEAAIADAIIRNRMINWNGISETTDQDGKPVWDAGKVILDGQRLPERWEELKEELANLEILASSQAFIDDGSSVSPATITLTPMLMIYDDLSNVRWYYKVNGSANWIALTNQTGISVNNTTKVVTVSSTCPLYTATNNTILFKCSYIEDNVEKRSDIMSIFYLTNGEGGSASYSVILSNEAQTIATDSDYYPVSSSTYECTVRVFRGITELSAANGDFTISAATTMTGVSVTTTSGGVVSITPSTSSVINPNFEVAVTITVPELDSPIIRVISLSASAAGESPITVEITSNVGNIFKNNNISAILTARVYKGSTDITSSVSSFTWTKKNHDGTIDSSWSRTIAGNSVTISASDVISRAIFEVAAHFT